MGRARYAAGVAVVAGALVSGGCGGGAPSSGPTVTVTAEPSAHPGGSQTGTRAPSGGGSTVPVGAPTPLPLDGQIVRIVTESGRTTCNVHAKFVECQSPEFGRTYPSEVDGGRPATGFRLTAGALEWNSGNMSVATPAHTVQYGHTYSAAGWTIDAQRDETVFTRNGHGVRVSFTNTVKF